MDNFQQANNAQEKQAAKNTIQHAYTNCSAEEQQQLQQLEQQLKAKNYLS
ncbi:DUF3813 family protein [Virgibacillus ainsalahensis]